MRIKYGCIVAIVLFSFPTILRVRFPRPSSSNSARVSARFNRARARVHQTFQDLYFIFNIARVAPAMIYFHQLANRVLSNHPLGSQSIRLYSLSILSSRMEQAYLVFFFRRFFIGSIGSSLRRKSGNKYLFPWETRIINRSVFSPLDHESNCCACKLTRRTVLLFNSFPIDG